MLSHFLLMVLYALIVSLFFTLLWRRDRREQIRLFLQIFLGMVGGGLLVAWLMYPVPLGPAGADSMSRWRMAGATRAAGRRRRGLGRPPRRAADLRAARGWCPDLAAFGLGGDEMRAAGLRAGGPQLRDRGGRHHRGAQDPAARRARSSPTCSPRWTAGARRVAVLIDFPDFNLRLAKRAQGARRARWSTTSARRCGPGAGGGCKHDRPPGRPHARALPVRGATSTAATASTSSHVGHPLVDEVPVLPQAWDRGAREPDDGPYRIALLPGSRPSEVEALLPAHAGGGAAARRASCRSRSRIIRAPTRPPGAAGRGRASSAGAAGRDRRARTASPPSPTPTWRSAPRAPRRWRSACWARR